MVDLGIFNFIKGALAQGQSKEAVRDTLTKGGWASSVIDEAFTAVEENRPPAAVAPRSLPANRMPLNPVISLRSGNGRPDIITALCGYYFFNSLLSFIRLFIVGLSLSTLPGTNVSFTPTANSLLGIGILVFTLVSIFGYWDMRKWGVILYTAITIGLFAYTMSHLLGPSQGPTAGSLIGVGLVGIVVSFILPAITIYVGFRHFNEMS